MKSTVRVDIQGLFHPASIWTVFPLFRGNELCPTHWFVIYYDLLNILLWDSFKTTRTLFFEGKVCQGSSTSMHHTMLVIYLWTWLFVDYPNFSWDSLIRQSHYNVGINIRIDYGNIHLNASKTRLPCFTGFASTNCDLWYCTSSLCYYSVCNDC